MDTRAARRAAEKAARDLMTSRAAVVGLSLPEQHVGPDLVVVAEP